MNFAWFTLTLLLNSEDISAGILGGLTSIFKNVTDEIQSAADSAVKETVSTIQQVAGKPVSEKDVIFYILTSEGEQRVLNISNPLIVGDNNKVFVIIHGEHQSSRSDWVVELTHEILKQNPTSAVLQVDWQNSGREEYAFAAYNTERIGEHVGTLIVKLTEKQFVPLNNFVLIGFSLGANVCSFAGKYFTKNTHLKLPIIVALDPPGLIFVSRPESEKLNKNDAEIVHVIHTDGGKLGTIAPCGTIDFYPNGGITQPGCLSLRNLNVTKTFTCDHTRAYEYFIESVRTFGSFPADECRNLLELNSRKCKKPDGGSVANMGSLSTDSTGIFYLETNAKSPFSKQISEQALIDQVFGVGKLDVRIGEDQCRICIHGKN